jgi:hypothetical protein
VKSPPILTSILLVIGLGFLAANVRLLADYVRFLKRRRRAVLIWRGPRPRNEMVSLVLGVVLGLLVIVKFWMGQQMFSETMMLVYFGGLMPLRQRIERGFYEDGIWADSMFIPYSEVGGISWREGEHDVTLIVISRLRNLARRLTVPGDRYGAARRVLRDKIGDHEIHFAGTGLNLGAEDERDRA